MPNWSGARLFEQQWLLRWSRAREWRRRAGQRSMVKGGRCALQVVVVAKDFRRRSPIVGAIRQVSAARQLRTKVGSYVV